MLCGFSPGTVCHTLLEYHWAKAVCKVGLEDRVSLSNSHIELVDWFELMLKFGNMGLLEWAVMLVWTIWEN